MNTVSIVTVCYNEPNLEDTCKSIVNQTYQDFEWIVIDACSNDNTQKVWNKYKYRIDTFICEPDDGVYDAYNKAIKLVKNKYVNFMNAGDSFYNNETLENIFNNKDYDVDIIYGNSNYLYTKNFSGNKYNCPQLLTDNVIMLQNINTQAMFIKKCLFEKYGYYNEKYKILADYDRTICFYKNHVNFKYIPIIVCNYNTNGISSDKKYVEYCRKEYYDIINKYFTQKEIEKFLNHNVKYSFLEQLFSIKNSATGSHKIITFLGCHLKIKRSQK